MNEPHSIRLAGPWKRSVLLDDGSREEEATCPMPRSLADDVAADFFGRVEYRRHFNCPTGIDDDTPLAINLQKAIGRELEVLLNGKPLGAQELVDGPSKYDIQGQLQQHNELCIRISTSDQTSLRNPAESGLVGVVTLEIG